MGVSYNISVRSEELENFKTARSICSITTHQNKRS